MLCGKHFQQEEAGLDELLEARSIPTGTESFVSACLDTHAGKVAGLVEVMVCLVSLATPDAPARQSATLLLRHCAAAKAAHLLRTLSKQCLLRHSSIVMCTEILAKLCRLGAWQVPSYVRDVVQLLGGQDGVISSELAQASWRDFGRIAGPKMQRTITNDLIEENWNVGVQQPASERSKQCQRAAQTRDRAQVRDELFTFALRLALGHAIGQRRRPMRGLHTKHSHCLWVSSPCRGGSCS